MNRRIAQSCKGKKHGGILIKFIDIAQYVEEESLDYKQMPDPYFFKQVTLYFSSLSKKAEVDLSFLKKFYALKFLHIRDVKFAHHMDSFPELEGVVELEFESCTGDLEFVGKMNQMKKLVVSRFVTEDCSFLSNLKSLEGCRIGGGQLISLNGIQGLPVEHPKLVGNSPKLTDLSEITSRSQLISQLNGLSIYRCHGVTALPDLTPLKRLEVIEVFMMRTLNNIDTVLEIDSLKGFYIVDCPKVKNKKELIKKLEDRSVEIY